MSPTFVPVTCQSGSPTTQSQDTKPELNSSASSPTLGIKANTRPASASSGIRNNRLSFQNIQSPFFPRSIAPSLAAAESLVNHHANSPSSSNKKSLSIFANKSMILPPHSFSSDSP